LDGTVPTRGAMATTAHSRAASDMFMPAAMQTTCR
jgi:hypothetical protein